MNEVIQSILSRVRTYSLQWWRYQSCQLLNPYVLASLGYSVEAFCTLQCHVCHHKVAISEKDEDNISQIEMRLNGHEKQCLYLMRANANITDKMLYFGMNHILQTIDSLSVKQIHEFPLINSKSLYSFVQNNILLFKTVLSLYESDSKYCKITFILQLLGWYLTINKEEKQCISCHFCGRTINIEQFGRTTYDMQNIELSEGIIGEKLFDPVEEHRYFCIWVTKSGGWLIFLQYLQDKYYQMNSFKFKTVPLETKRAKIQIQMYVDSFKNKLDSTLSKLKHVTHQVGNLCEKMGKDHNLSIPPQQSSTDVKKLRNRQSQLQVLRQNINSYYREFSLEKHKLY